MATQKGIVHLLILIAGVGVLVVFLVLSLAPFKHNLFSALYPKNNSFAATTVGKYDVLELTFTYPSTSLTDPYNNAVVEATFTSPSGKTLKVPGFYYDVNTYKVRFSPAEIGNYSYSVNITGPTAFTPQTGSFTSIASSNHGPVRKVPGSPYKLMYDDGSLFYGIGIGDCPDPNNPTYGVIGEVGYEPTGESGAVPWNTYFQKYGPNGGFNLYRWNCTDPATNLVAFDKARDTIYAEAKANGFHNLTVLFPGNGVSIPDPVQNPSEETQFKNRVRYLAARFGAYTDMWELSNETQSNMNGLLDYTRNYLATVNPYNMLLTNSNPTSLPPNVDFISPHKYGSNVDFYNLTNKTSGPPVIPGEVGRCAGSCSNIPYTVLVVTRTRVVDWTSFFGGVGNIWWNTSYNRNCCNQYLGATERAHNLVLSNFVKNSNIDTNATAAIATTGANRMGYTLTSANSVVGYIYDAGFSASAVNTSITLNVPFNGTLTWIDTKNGDTVSTVVITSGTKTLTTPNFVEDIALRITSSVAVSPSPSATLAPSPSPSASSAKTGDIDGNGRVDIFDYNIILTNFGKTGSSIQGDLDSSGKVDIFDYNILLSNFGK